jgi:4-alpha-glucanotransferase
MRDKKQYGKAMRLHDILIHRVVEENFGGSDIPYNISSTEMRELIRDTPLYKSFADLVQNQCNLNWSIYDHRERINNYMKRCKLLRLVRDLAAGKANVYVANSYFA